MSKKSATRHDHHHDDHRHRPSTIIHKGTLAFADEETTALCAALSLGVAMVDDFAADEASLAAMAEPALLDFVPLPWRDRGGGEAGWAAKVRG